LPNVQNPVEEAYGMLADGEIRGHQTPSSPTGYSASRMASISASLAVSGSRP
jgi:hypothetical protein